MANNHYSPLLYPGGKGKLFQFVKDLIVHNKLDGGSYSEPYAGGASVALGLLIEDYVSEIHINDVDPSIYSFWHSVLFETDAFLKKLWDTPVNMRQWKKQKLIQENKAEYDHLELGFSTFFLNRTNRSGVLKAGVIGGNDQTGNYKIDARYNKDELARRINTIANHGRNIHIYQQDAVRFITKTIPKKKTKGLVFLDPPYYVQGHRLYTSFYKHEDHVEVAEAIKNSPLKHWIVTYDNTDAINEIYDLNRKVVYNLRYSISHTSASGAEVLFHSKNVKLPYKEIVG